MARQLSERERRRRRKEREEDPTSQGYVNPKDDFTKKTPNQKIVLALFIVGLVVLAAFLIYLGIAFLGYKGAADSVINKATNGSPQSYIMPASPAGSSISNA